MRVNHKKQLHGNPFEFEYETDECQWEVNYEKWKIAWKQLN